MGRLIGLMVFFAVAAMTVPAFITRNPEIVEDAAKATEGLTEVLPVAKKVALSGEERIDMNRQGHFIAVLDDKALGGTLLGMSFLRELKSFRVEDSELILKQ